MQKLTPQVTSATMASTLKVDMFLTSYKQHTPQWRNNMPRVLYWNYKSPLKRQADYVQQIRTSPCNGIQENPKTQGR